MAVELVPYGNMEVYNMQEDYPDVNTPNRYNYKKRSLNDVDTIVIHHWASRTFSPNESMEDEIAAMEAVRQMWMRNDKDHNTAGYPYHLTTFPSGRQYWNGALDTNRACVGHHNHHIICIVLAGNFNYEAPIDQHLNATRDVVANTQLILGDFKAVEPHKTFTPTSCPGKTWDQWADQVTVRRPE